MMSLSIDFARAFDNVDVMVTMHKLISLGVKLEKEEEEERFISNNNYISTQNTYIRILYTV